MSSAVGLFGTDSFMDDRPLCGTSIAALVGRTIKSKRSLDVRNPNRILRWSVSLDPNHGIVFRL
jgi:hypothetical protein